MVARDCSAATTRGSRTCLHIAAFRLGGTQIPGTRAQTFLCDPRCWTNATLTAVHECLWFGGVARAAVHREWELAHAAGRTQPQGSAKSGARAIVCLAAGKRFDGVELGRGALIAKIELIIIGPSSCHGVLVESLTLVV
jgi:hypothetical protein